MGMATTMRLSQVAKTVASAKLHGHRGWSVRSSAILASVLVIFAATITTQRLAAVRCLSMAVAWATETVSQAREAVKGLASSECVFAFAVLL